MQRSLIVALAFLFAANLIAAQTSTVNTINTTTAANGSDSSNSGSNSGSNSNSNTGTVGASGTSGATTTTTTSGSNTSGSNTSGTTGTGMTGTTTSNNWWWLWVKSCQASACGNTCSNCSSATWVNNTNTATPLVICPANGTFCYVNYYWANGTSTVQNCSSCANSMASSCTGCNWVWNSFSQDWCSANGSCWSIYWNNTWSNSWTSWMNGATGSGSTSGSTSSSGTSGAAAGTGSVGPITASGAANGQITVSAASFLKSGVAMIVTAVAGWMML